MNNLVKADWKLQFFTAEIFVAKIPDINELE